MYLYSIYASRIGMLHCKRGDRPRSNDGHYAAVHNAIQLCVRRRRPWSYNTSVNWTTTQHSLRHAYIQMNVYYKRFVWTRRARSTWFQYCAYCVNNMLIKIMCLVATETQFSHFLRLYWFSMYLHRHIAYTNMYT